MVELTLAAAMQLRTMLRAVGVVGLPGVRIRPGLAGEDSPVGAPAGPRPADRVEIVIEDRAEAGDRVGESRGIRLYLDPVVASVVGDAVLDLDGTDFVLRRSAS